MRSRGAAMAILGERAPSALNVVAADYRQCRKVNDRALRRRSLLILRPRTIAEIGGGVDLEPAGVDRRPVDPLCPLRRAAALGAL